LCREEAKELSSLQSQFDAHGFNLIGIVHEEPGVDKFRPFFNGPIYLDSERRFYGPKERWMFLSGFIRPSVWSSIFRARGKGVEGNMKGEGRLLGGLFVVGAGDLGVLLEHRESEFGDHANTTSILDVVKSHAAAKTKL
jgi:hypothetical protein